jgi:hypothetical protein
MMDTVLFTDHSIVVFVILTSAIALIFSVLGLATTHQIRFDMKDNFCLDGAQARTSTPNEWASLRDEFSATVRERADTFEDLLDEQFRRRFSELMLRTARARHRHVRSPASRPPACARYFTVLTTMFGHAGHSNVRLS